MDATDHAVLRAVAIEPFSMGARPARPWRPEAVAQRANVAVRLAKDRLARLERDGVVAGYQAHPNLRLLGLDSRTYAFRLPVRADRQERLRRVAGIAGVLAYVDYVTGWLTVTVAFDGEAERTRRLTLVQEALGADPPVTWFAVGYPAPARAISALDWRILAALRSDARMGLADLGRAVGASAKTAQRRLDRMAAEGSFDTFATLAPAAFDRLLVCSLSVRVRPEAARSAIHALHAGPLADAWSHCSAPLVEGGLHHDLVATARTPRGLAQLLDKAAQIPGVVDVEGHLACAASFVPGWIDAQLQARCTPQTTLDS